MIHKNLGAVEIDDACKILNAKNPDPFSVFVKVLSDGEIKEVSRMLIMPVILPRQLFGKEKE